MATSLSDLIPVDGAEGYGLSREGVREAVDRHCEFAGHNTTKSLLSVRDLYHVLIVRDQATADELLDYFRPYSNHVPEQGHYAEIAAEQWWMDVGAPQLAQLPGVVVDDAVVRFEGVNPSDFDDEHVRPLEEIRNDPEVRVDLALDRLGVERGSDEREDILALLDALRESGSATSEDLDRAVHGVSFAEHADTLAKLPGVERTEEHPPAPEEIEIETYADVLDARETVEQDAVVRWSAHY